MPTKEAKTKTKPGRTAGAVSVKIPRRAYSTAARIAKRERRTITTTIELAIEKLAESSS